MCTCHEPGASPNYIPKAYHVVVIKSLSLSLANTHIHTHAQSKDTTGYDEYVEGVEPDETASLERHIGEVGVASHDCSHGNKQMSVCVCVCCV